MKSFLSYQWQFFFFFFKFIMALQAKKGAICGQHLGGSVFHFIRLIRSGGLSHSGSSGHFNDLL